MSGLGRALKHQLKAQRANAQALNLNEDGVHIQPLQSITQQASLDEFLQTAQMAETSFMTERTRMKLGLTSDINSFPSDDAINSIEKIHRDKAHLLRIPRRPRFTPGMTAQELDKLERQAFVDWRRQLAEVSDAPDLVMTPFERNIEIWRQLWRVIERADLLVQVVDARNPLFFRCPDVEIYSKEVDPCKSTMLLVNKADLLTLDQRQILADYFSKNNIEHVFFSAKDAESDLENKLERENGPLDSRTRILTPDELATNLHKIALSSRMAAHEKKSRDSTKNVNSAAHIEGPATISFVGYPNVGKSSTLNSLTKAKKVSVSATPGKTKHFQTIRLDENCTLCDCPGLVFPNFASTKADLLTNGVLPIHEMRDFRAPVELIVRRIPAEFLARYYSLKLPLLKDGIHTSAEGLLSTYAASRGMFTTNHGNPDESRAARRVLQDYVNGLLLYCHVPVDCDVSEDQYNKLGFLARKIDIMTNDQTDAKKNSKFVTSQEALELESRKVDAEFFKGTKFGAESLAFGGKKKARGKGKKARRQNETEKFYHLGRSTKMPHQQIMNDDCTLKM